MAETSTEVKVVSDVSVTAQALPKCAFRCCFGKEHKPAQAYFAKLELVVHFLSLDCLTSFMKERWKNPSCSHWNGPCAPQTGSYFH